MSGPAPHSTALINFAFNDATLSATGPANCSSGAGAGAAACGGGASGSGSGAAACGGGASGSASAPPTSSPPLKSIALEFKIRAISSLS